MYVRVTAVGADLSVIEAILDAEHSRAVVEQLMSNTQEKISAATDL